MPGTLVRDAAGPVLLNSTPLTATVTGAAIDAGKPASCRARLNVSGAVSGTTPTLDVTIQASDSSTFASGVVNLGRFVQATGVGEKFLKVDVQHRFVRAVATVGGTSPSFGTVLITLEEDNFRRTKGETA